MRTFEQMAVDFRRSRLGPFLTQSILTDIHLGESLPQLANVRILSDSTLPASRSRSRVPTSQSDHLSDVPLALSIDFQYAGGISGIVKMDTIFGFPVWIQATVEKLDGPVIVIFEGDALYYSFLEFKCMQFAGRVNINGHEFTLLNKLFHRILLPWYFKHKFRYPAMRTKWVANKPPQPPYPWDPSVVVSPDLLHSWMPVGK